MKEFDIVITARIKAENEERAKPAMIDAMINNEVVWSIEEVEDE